MHQYTETERMGIWEEIYRAEMEAERHQIPDYDQEVLGVSQAQERLCCYKIPGPGSGCPPSQEPMVIPAGARVLNVEWDPPGYPCCLVLMVEAPLLWPGTLRDEKEAKELEIERVKRGIEAYSPLKPVEGLPIKELPEGRERATMVDVFLC